MRDDLKEAAALVKAGLSYQQAANRLGLTRNQVAGACDRAGLRTKRGANPWPYMTAEARQRHAVAVTKGMKELWQRRFQSMSK